MGSNWKRIITLGVSFCVIAGLVGCGSKRRKRVVVPVKKEEPMKSPMAPKELQEKPVEKVVLGEKKAPMQPMWSYAGETGPVNWGSLSPLYIQCSEGQAQSPIDLKWQRPIKGEGVQTSYQAVNYKVMNDGHSIKVDAAGAGETSIHGEKFSLQQIHFRSPSEHTIGGKSFPLEAQFIHKNHEGELGVLGVVFEVGAPNAQLTQIWKSAPAGKGDQMAGQGMFNPATLLPAFGTHYKYMGSLTTPPCAEGVNWILFNTPMQLSQAQLEQFRKLYFGNNRPIQPTNGRNVTNF